jgi:hypothetical protein
MFEIRASRGFVLLGVVAHTYNPSYSGVSDQEDHGSKPARENSSGDPISKIPITKIGLVEWLKVKALSSSPGTIKKKKKKGFVSFLMCTILIPPYKESWARWWRKKDPGWRRASQFSQYLY